MNEVEAIKTEEQLTIIKGELMRDGDIYSDVFQFGINTALRISDLLSIKFSEIEIDSEGSAVIRLKEQKTGKRKVLTLNSGAQEVIERRRAAHKEDEYLFQVHSNRTRGSVKSISRQSVSRVFQSIGEKWNIKLNTHTMRKTRGYMMYKNGVPLETIARVLNHSSSATTMRYIGITAQDVKRSYEDLVL